MKTAGDILAALFDEGFVKKAQGYNNLFDSWEDITAKNGITAASAHSRIKDLSKGILLVEIDHPGWKQIIQTKQSQILSDFQRRFPDMDISAISLMLGTPPKEPIPEIKLKVTPPVTQKPAIDETVISSIEDIKDEELKAILLRLGKTIEENESPRR